MHTKNMGSGAYMAPEVIKGQYDKSVDWYSLGILTYQMITGKYCRNQTPTPYSMNASKEC